MSPPSLEIVHPSFALDDLEPAGLRNGDASGVVAAIFEAM
jgi:hypothetical protein